jgi:hypothetical protein
VEQELTTVAGLFIRIDRDDYKVISAAGSLWVIITFALAVLVGVVAIGIGRVSITIPSIIVKDERSIL